jgi:cytochrome c oxidase assembly protein Cox11
VIIKKYLSSRRISSSSPPLFHLVSLRNLDKTSSVMLHINNHYTKVWSTTSKSNRQTGTQTHTHTHTHTHTRTVPFSFTRNATPNKTKQQSSKAVQHYSCFMFQEHKLLHQQDTMWWPFLHFNIFKSVSEENHCIL